MIETEPSGLTLELADEAATLALGRRLGAFLGRPGPEKPDIRVLLLYGDLGSGKTTLTRGIADVLAGKENAEVTSPSFTLCNIYPTRPAIAHCDLYRSGEAAQEALPEEAENVLEAGGCVVVEWAERLAPENLPSERLDIRLQACKDTRLATLTAHGGPARRVLQELRGVFRGALQD